MFFEKALDQPAHTGSGAFFLLPVYCPVLTEQIGQLFCNCNQFVMFVEVFDGLGFGQSIVECKLVGGQSQLFALCICIGNFFGKLQKLLNDFLIGQHPIQVSVHCTLNKFRKLL